MALSADGLFPTVGDFMLYAIRVYVESSTP